MKADDAREKILARRARFVRVALAGVSVVGVGGCDHCGPQVCLEPPMPLSASSKSSAQAVPSRHATSAVNDPGAMPCLAPPRPPAWDLSNMKLDDATLATKLADGSLPVTLAREVNLRGNQLTAAGLRAIGRALPEPIDTLYASGNPIGDAGAEVLAKEKVFAGLRSMVLRRCGLTAKGVETLYGSDSGLVGPRQVDLSGNAIGDEGVAAIARSPKAAKLSELQLSSTRMTDAGVDLLAASPHFVKVYRIVMQANRLDQAAIDRLSAAKAFKRARIKVASD